MTEGITVDILGDYGPFSSIGKSIGYRITVGGTSFLLDCGAPLFQQIGGHGLKGLKGLLITHCHDDHKRWFSDLALFHQYAADFRYKLSLLTTDEVHQEIIRASGPALDRSLSLDSRRIMDIPYDAFVDFTRLGPQARYRIVSRNEGEGVSRFVIVDRSDNPVPAALAKIVINPTVPGRPRMLFRDPEHGEWVEPQSFYPFSSDIFYQDRNVYTDDEGFTLEAIKSPVWHGIPAMGLRIRTGNETLVFSSDTVHDTNLWASLCSERLPQVFSSVSRDEFETASVIYGDINDFIERAWSRERFNDALATFRDCFTIHDISGRNSVVHTDYARLETSALDRTRTLLTHGPDTMTSEWVLCESGKRYRIVGSTIMEDVHGDLFNFNADIYHKEGGKFFVGYKSAHGRYTVYNDNGLLRLSDDGGGSGGAPMFRVDLYQDIGGRYFPKLYDPNISYFERGDGKVEILRRTPEGSYGVIINDRRRSLAREKAVHTAMG
ncbi:MAG: hypothetical protein HZA20_11645 [Nitrospirae bacterium]|nr:hypothetical protein [Nitrospirota bacterium]